jgi:trans-2,3-dihydro-3-hydroxyanthranilate isomerase
MTERLRYVTADVFTTKAFGGNPLAVVLDGRGLSDAQMQMIAREFNLSETTFIFPPKNPAHTAQVRIFTPAAEIPFAGHPTVGTAWVMAAQGMTPRGQQTQIVFEENVGPVPVTIRFSGEQPSYVSFTTAMTPEELPAPPPRGELAAMLGLNVEDLCDTGTPPLALTCGTPYTCVPLVSAAAVSRAQLDMVKWRAVLASSPAHKVFVFAQTDAETLYARMFAPGEGVAEDPATGSAACAVAGWLEREHKLTQGARRWTIRQGVDMGRPSEIFIEVEAIQGRISAVRCGGTAVLISEGTIRRPG